MTNSRDNNTGHRASRRRFLAGVGGALLTIPLLPSLEKTKQAHAEPLVRKRFVQFIAEHGGVYPSNVFPADATLTEQQSYAGRAVKRGDLTVQNRDGRSFITPLLSAAPTVLTPALAAKMNVIRGLDYTFRISHHGGGHLGNYSANTGSEADAITAQSLGKRRTIDQVMGWSPSIYPAAAPARLRNIVLGGGVSYNHSNPAARTGELQDAVNYGYLWSVEDLFDDLFGGAAAPTSTPRPLIIDRVIEDYRRLRNGNRRLSTDDRRRLDDHVERITELQRRLGSRISCTTPTKPTRYPDDSEYDRSPLQQAGRWQRYNEVVAAGLACGASSVATMALHSTFSTFAGEWHQDIAHEAYSATQQRTLTESYQRMFETVFLDLARRLDAIDDGGGRTVLDNTLMVFTQESGDRIHGSYSVPVITMGSAGGFLRTGSYIDYRNRGITIGPSEGPGLEPSYAGLGWSQWLATALLAMGIPKTEWEEPGGGYGARYVGREATAGNWYPGDTLRYQSDPLPYLRPAV